jgi:hypothetical protein
VKHKHDEMIVAKAANTGLVQFIKMDGEWENAGLSDKFISFSEEYDYFLCLPQHKEACLHWLNGGDVRAIHFENQMPDSGVMFDSDFVDVEDGVDTYPWKGNHIFMQEHEIEIKPKKEKRWIIWDENQDSYHCAFLADPSDRYEANFKFSIHEIEVEV